MRVILLGNAGSGKSTMARALAKGSAIAHLSLDEIAWNPGPVRKPLDESVAALSHFIETNAEWIIEGCYGDLVEPALPHCTELRFLNPGVETCVEHCRSRPWEPDKFANAEAQDAMLDGLIAWVRTYADRDDEYGLACHRRIFDGFAGRKREYASVSSYGD